MQEKSQFWADNIVEEIKKRVEEKKVLKDTVKRVGKWVINDSKTPSGRIHIGSGRGWIIHDTIARALREAKINAVFTLGCDDMDPFNKRINGSLKCHLAQIVSLTNVKFINFKNMN